MTSNWHYNLEFLVKSSSEIVKEAVLQPNSRILKRGVLDFPLDVRAAFEDLPVLAVGIML